MQCQVGCIALSGAPVTLTYSRRTTNIPVTIVFFTDESFPLHGVIKRTQVLRMLKHRIGLFTHDGMSALPPAKARIPKSQVKITALLPCCSGLRLLWWHDGCAVCLSSHPKESGEN